MSETALVADTTSYLPPDLVAEHDIHLISLYVGLEGDQQKESEITDLDAFYERLRKSEAPVITSQPSLGDFISCWEPLLADGREVVSIHIASGISGTYESALQAKERLTAEDKGGERIAVVDSETGAGGMGLMVLAAARAISQGASATDAAERAKTLRKGLKIYFAVDTLDYLKRGGRIGAARAWIGSTLKIKPILTLEQEITPIERVRTRARAFERMEDYARQRQEDGADAWVVQHVQDPEAAAELVEACKGIYGRDPLYTSEIGPVLGAHVGPGLIGVGGVASELLEF